MNQIQFKGIKQTTLSKFKNATDKLSYLWFVTNGDKKQIYLGENLYAEIPYDTTASSEDIINGLTLTEDKIIKLVDKNGEAFGEGVSVGDIIKGKLIDKVAYDTETKELTITFDTLDEEHRSVVLDFSDLADTSDKIIIDKDITGLDENASLNDVLSDIYSKFTPINDKLAAVENKVSTVEETLEELQTTLEEVAENAVKLEEANLETVVEGHIEIKRNDKKELYGVMYYLNDIISGQITAEDVKVFTDEAETSVDIYDATFEAKAAQRLNITKKEDVTLYNVDITTTKLTNSGVINIKDTKEIELTNVNINKEGNGSAYNAVEIGLNTKGEKEAIVPNKLNIKNCNFDGTYTNNMINIFGTDDNTEVNISGCHFGKCSNVMRLSNRTNAEGVVINITDCTVDEWDTTEYAGLFICQDYTSTDAEATNLFGDGKITINIKNLKVNGVAIDKNYVGQIGYVYTNGSIVANELGDDKMPVVNFL